MFDEHGGKRPKGGWGLVIEHLYPRELLVGYLLGEGQTATPPTPWNFSRHV